MKKVISVLLSVASAFCFIFAFSGCKDEEIKVSGEFYTLKEAYDEALLNEEDLKNISCGYYELYQFDIYSEYENLYSGLYDPHEELSQSKERELKLAYLEHIKHPEYSNDSVKILYYGTYNGNIVAGLSCDYIIIDIVSHEKFEIGGVMFYKFWEGRILVYHCS